MHNLKHGNIVVSYYLLTQVISQTMIEAIAKRRIGGATIVLVFILIIQGFLPAKTLAQGHSQEQFRETVGPYEIGVTTVPSTLSLGRVQFIVTVLNSADRQPVPNARVTLRVKHELDEAEGWGLAVHTTAIPERYDAQMNLDKPGVWEVNIEVASSLGEASVEIPSVLIRSPRTYTDGSFVFAGIMVVLIVGFGYLWWSQREQRKHSAELTHESPEEGGRNGS